MATVAPIPAAPPVVPVGLPSELLLRRPDVALAERQLAAATANIGVAKADLFPKFYLTGIAGFEGASAGRLVQSPAASSGRWVQPCNGEFLMPGASARTSRSRTRVRNRRWPTTSNTALSAFEDVENALTAYAKEQIRRRSLEDAVKSSQESLRLANQLYANGLSNFINVLDAERSLYQAQDALVQSDRTISTDLIALYKSLGGGWETQPSSALAFVAATNQ